MLTTPLEICNLALVPLQMRGIQSFDDGSEKAEKCKATFYPVTRQVLRGFPWNVAKQYASLDAAAGASGSGYAYQYLLPNDYLFLREVKDALYPYEIAGGYILTDNPAPLSIVYTRDLLIDPTTLKEIAAGQKFRADPLFVNAVAMRLAVVLSRSLTGTKVSVSDMASLYREAILEARALDAMELPAEIEETGTWADV